VERVLEPEVMDSEEEAREYDAMDFAQSDRAFAERAASMVGNGEVTIVDLGCGPCNIAILMAGLLPNARFLCVDLAASMLDLARVKLARLGLSERVTLLQADVKATGLPAGSFDLVMSNSTMHHLAEPTKLLREMKRLLAPHGALLLMDLFRPLTTEAAWAIVDSVSPDDSARQRGLFFDSLCAALTVEEAQSIVQAAELEGAVVEPCSARHLRISRERALPS
jgi:ubiquinone/menaquinone biosynthesis C-methylase UbiE